jgi:hypothetical protein
VVDDLVDVVVVVVDDFVDEVLNKSTDTSQLKIACEAETYVVDVQVVLDVVVGQRG